MRAIDGFDGHAVTRAALRLAPHVFVRPGELRHAEWSEIDFDKALWSIPAEKMKMRRPHRVPLSRQSLAILSSIREVAKRVAIAAKQVRHEFGCSRFGSIGATMVRLDPEMLRNR